MRQPQIDHWDAKPLTFSSRRWIAGAEPLLAGAALTKSAVSRLVLRLEESYRSWQGRDLAEEKIVYLYLDAIYPKVRSGGRVVSLPVLVALGVQENGEKVLLSLMTTGAESADGWQLLLDDLAARKWRRPRLVISDGNAGLAAALDWCGPACCISATASYAICWRKHRNTRTKRCAKRSPHGVRRDPMRPQETREGFLLKWKKTCPGVSRLHWKRRGENLLTFYRFPESQWRSLVTRNGEKQIYVRRHHQGI